jgi:hypothetical protein
MNKNFLKTTIILGSIALLSGNALAAVGKKYDEGGELVGVSVSDMTGQGQDVLVTLDKTGDGSAAASADINNYNTGDSISRDVTIMDNGGETVAINGGTEVTKDGVTYSTGQNNLIVSPNQVQSHTNKKLSTRSSAN